MNIGFKPRSTMMNKLRGIISRIIIDNNEVVREFKNVLNNNNNNTVEQ